MNEFDEYDDIDYDEYDDDWFYSKAQGGPGNKRSWKVWMPKWLYKKYKEQPDENS